MKASVVPQISLLARLSVLLVAAAFAGSAATLNFTGPTLLDGTPCMASDPGCIIGSPLSFEVFSVSLSQPTSPGGNWTLTIQTNYPSPIPTPGAAIPPAPWHDGLLYSIPDFLINWDGTNYGVILASHIQGGVAVAPGYVAGDLYQGPTGMADITSGQVLPPAFPSPRPTGNVWLAPGGTLLGAGSFTVTNTGNGSSAASYTITESFAAPAGFLSDGNTFSILASSYTCDNGVLVATGNFTTTGNVPEPSTFLLALPALAFLGRRYMSRSKN